MASTTDQPFPSRKSYQDFAPVFAARGIRFVRIQWVDLNNQIRCRILPVSYFRKLLQSERPGVTVAKAVLGIVVLQPAPGFSGVGEYIYVVDTSSFRVCSYAPGHAVFYGFFQEQIAVPRPNGPSIEVPCCPRSTLSRIVRSAAQDLGIQFLVGVETEFTLLKSINPLVPVNDSQFTTSDAFRTGSVEARVLEEIADAIEADGIELQMYHSEGAPGQYEVVTGPMPPLEAADALVHTRETIYNIAHKHGLRATFAPRLDMNSCGSGAHMHVSVRGPTSPGPSSELLTPVESAFLAGLMNHLPSIIALTLPLSASYARMADGVWSGGTYLSWGIDNREAPVRLTKATSPASRNFEVRPVDGTSCPYVAVAGVLACGVIGVRDQYALTVENNEAPKPAALLSDEERAALGIVKRLPLNVVEARQRLAADEAVKDVLGRELVDNFINVNEMLAKVIDRREGEDEWKAVVRLVENY